MSETHWIGSELTPIKKEVNKKKKILWTFCSTSDKDGTLNKKFWQVYTEMKQWDQQHWRAFEHIFHLPHVPTLMISLPSAQVIKVERFLKSQFRKMLIHWQQLIGVRLISRLLIKNNPQYITSGNSAINQNTKFMFPLGIKNDLIN